MRTANSVILLKFGLGFSLRWLIYIVILFDDKFDSVVFDGAGGTGHDDDDAIDDSDDSDNDSDGDNNDTGDSDEYDSDNDDGIDDDGNNLQWLQ